MKTPKKYIRLPGKHKDLVGNYFHLWRAKDHLLSVSYRFGDEYYKRFYYKDIQTIIIRKTAFGKVQDGIMGGMTVLFGVMAFFTGDVGALIFGILASATTLLLFINIIFHGPTCECYIQTAVQKEKLKSLKFLKRAVKVTDIIKKLIEQAQGVISAQELNTAFKAAASKETTVNIDETSSLPLHSNIHLALFILLVLLGLCVAYSFFHQTLVASFVELLLGLGASVVMVMALVRQYQIRITRNVRVITWVTLGYICGYLACGYALFIFLLIKNPTLANNQWELFKTMAALSPLSHPLLTGIGIFTISGALICGISGLFLLKRS
ncbi:hypothetical protein QUF75_00735 [Desulfococcaceae bacterium HSG7]|nr:hypothetical protein [Desulfococcaceae bacterium HSG7]